MQDCAPAAYSVCGRSVFYGLRRFDIEIRSWRDLRSALHSGYRAFDSHFRKKSDVNAHGASVDDLVRENDRLKNELDTAIKSTIPCSRAR